MKKTKWFPCSVKPVRPGWYEVGFGGRIFECVGMCQFNGGRWRKWDNGEKAIGPIRPGVIAGDMWRGIVK